MFKIKHKPLYVALLLILAVLFEGPLSRWTFGGDLPGSAVSAETRVHENETAGAHGAEEATPADIAGARQIDWDDLLELNLKTGRPGPKLKNLIGKTVKLPGYMVPLDEVDMDAKVNEFLVVPYAQACIHVPAPPPNQIVHGKVPAGGTVGYDGWQPFWFYGKIKIQKTKNVFTEASFVMQVQRLKPYTREYQDY